MLTSIDSIDICSSSQRTEGRRMLVVSPLPREHASYNHAVQAKLPNYVQRPCAAEGDGQTRVDNNRTIAQPLPRLSSCTQQRHRLIKVGLFPKLAHEIPEGHEIRITEVGCPPTVMRPRRHVSIASAGRRVRHTVGNGASAQSASAVSVGENCRLRSFSAV